LKEEDWKTANSDHLATHIFILRTWNKRMLVNPCRFIPTGMGKLQPARQALCEAVRWRRTMFMDTTKPTGSLRLCEICEEEKAHIWYEDGTWRCNNCAIEYGFIPETGLLSKKMNSTRIKDE